MTPIEFSAAERADIAARIKAWFRDELDQEIGRLPAEMLLDFFTKEIGGDFYNRGLYDAQAVVAARADDISEAILGLERARGR
ncbi:DUF2164 domain-containing protein [Brevundimonas sp.]|uniref:DUF2164 domain-containing protein n=1 Tax=Brevundimonas sp. TaxID=1871086 RepID=UPI003A8FAC97